MMYIHMAGKTKRRCAINSVEQLFSKLYFIFAVEIVPDYNCRYQK